MIKTGLVPKRLSNINPIAKKTPTLTAISTPLPSESDDDAPVRATGLRIGKSFNFDPQLVFTKQICLALVNGNTN
ncbi:MAG: hypothetical protein ACKO93_00390 [Acidimicrobiaceae bacterium]